MNPTILPTFSELPRRLACEATDVLPRCNTVSEASLAGDARHKFFTWIAQLLTAGDCTTLEKARELALDDLDLEDRVLLEALPLEALQRLQLDTVAPEVALAYDVETGECRELGRDLGRKYDEAGRRPTEIVGAIDRLTMIGTDRLYVGDYKGRSHTRAPGEDAQFLAAAFVGSRVYERRGGAEIEVIRIIGGELFHQVDDVDQLTLDAFEFRLQDLAKRIDRNRVAYLESGGLDLPPATEGEHCTWCPHARFCPAKMAIARATIGQDSQELLQVVKEGQALITTENAAKLYRLKHEGEKLLEQLGDALKLFARQTPFTLENGKTYGVPPDAEERELLDGPQVAEVVAEILDDDSAELVLKKEAAFTRIDQAIKAHLGDRIKRGDLKSYGERIEQELIRRGLLRVVKGGVVRAFTPKTTGKAKPAA